MCVLYAYYFNAYATHVAYSAYKGAWEIRHPAYFVLDFE